MSTARTENDARLVTRTLSGDDSAFTSLAERYTGAVFGLALTHVKNPSDAEDVVQDTFLAAYTKLNTLAKPGKFGHWLMTIARNKSRSLLRRRKVEHDAVNVPAEPAHQTPQPDRDELRQLLVDEVEQLDTSTREALTLYYFGQKQTREVAALLGISRSAAAKRLQRGRQALGERLVARLGEAVSRPDEDEQRVTKTMALVAVARPAWKTAEAASVATVAKAGVSLGAFGVLKLLGLCAALGVVAFAVWRSGGEDTPEPLSAASTSSAQAASAPENLVSSALTTPVTPIEHEAADAGIAITGRVLLPSGTPAPEATALVLEEGSDTPRTRQTDADGLFSFSGFPDGAMVTVRAEAEGMRSPGKGPVALRAPGLSGLELRLAVTGGVQGRVTDFDGNPVHRASVTVRAKDANDCRTVTTDEEGRYSAEKLLPVLYGVSAEPPSGQHALGRPSASVSVQSGIVRAVKDLVLDLGGDLTVSGRVTDPKGNPLEGAFVGVWNTTHGDTRTDADGRYVVEGLSQTEYGIEAHLAGYASRTNWQVQAGAEDCEFVLPKAQTVFKGQVLAADTGEPITDFEAMALPGMFPETVEQWRDDEALFKRFSDPEGRFEFDGVSSQGQTWVLYVVRASGYALTHKAVTIEEGGDPPDVVLELEREAIVEGVVVDADGNPVPGTGLYVGTAEDLHNRGGFEAGKADSTGAFTIPRLAAFITEISAYQKGYAPVSVPVTLQPGQTTRIEIVLSSGATVSGRVLLDGNPLADAYMTIHVPGELGGSLQNTRTDGLGNYRFTSLSAGGLEVSAFLPKGEGDDGVHRTIKPVTVSREGNHRLDFDLRSNTGVLEGRVHCGGQMPSSGHVRLFVDSAGRREFVSAQIEQGAFRAEGLPDGAVRYEIGAFFDGRRDVVRRKTGTATVSGEGTPIDVDFSAGGTLSASLTGLKPDEEVFIDVFQGELAKTQLTDAPYRTLTWQGPVQSDRTFTATGFDPGTYTVRVALEADEFVGFIVDLPADGTTHVDIDVD